MHSKEQFDFFCLDSVVSVGSKLQITGKDLEL
jgi:hypothetical protein